MDITYSDIYRAVDNFLKGNFVHFVLWGGKFLWFSNSFPNNCEIIAKNVIRGQVMIIVYIFSWIHGFKILFLARKNEKYRKVTLTIYKRKKVNFGEIGYFNEFL